jgi:hypothetical protein
MEPFKRVEKFFVQRIVKRICRGGVLESHVAGAFSANVNTQNFSVFGENFECLGELSKGE